LRLKKTEDRLTELQSTNSKLASEIATLSKRLQSDKKNIKKILNEIESTNDLKTLKDLCKLTISRITVHICTASITVLQIEYTNEKHDYLIYAPRLLKHHYITISEPLYFNGEDKLIHSESYPVLISGDGVRWFSNETEETIHYYEEVYGHESFFRAPFSVNEYIRQLRHGHRLYPFERLEKPTEQAKQQEIKHKEWQKKHNNGLPTSLPHVVKDATYDHINKEKKHLYNRKYKIKNHKKLTTEEKQKKLAEIDERLALLSAQIKYLSRSDAIKAYLKE
jgi:hypothetical protein